MLIMILITSLFIIGLIFGLTQMYPQQWMKLKDLYDVYIVGPFMYVAFIIADKLCSFQNTFKNPQRRDGQIAIVTGGGRGIGLEVVKGLMKSGMTVIMAVRRPEACKLVIGDLINEFSQGKVTAMELDLSSMKSVRGFVKKFSAQYSKLHILVNNASILDRNSKTTEDGFEEKLATNYIGHFLLTHLLIDKMKVGSKDGDLFSRIVNVSSCAHVYGRIDWDDINFKNHYSFVKAYCQSKLAQLMFSRRLDKSFEFYDIPIRSYAVNPGIVGNDTFKSILKTFGSWATIFSILARTPEQGAVSVLFACLSPTLERQSDKYISNCGDGFCNSQSKSKMDQDRLFKQTMTMLNIQQFGVPVGFYNMTFDEEKSPNVNEDTYCI